MLEFLTRGEDRIFVWLALFVICGIVTGILSGFFRTRKIQPEGLDWRQLRREILLGIINMGVVGVILVSLIKAMQTLGWIFFISEPVAWWMICLEYALFWVFYDTYFYWVHRAFHKEPFYTWIHKVHHLSTKPNVLTSLSTHPVEAAIEGMTVPLFFALFTVHEATMTLIMPTSIIIGFYVHSGYEFMPRWWNRSWVTKWLMTPTFHDQHHHYFTGNYGGYTTIWDRLCGTVQPRFEAEFRARKIA